MPKEDDVVTLPDKGDQVKDHSERVEQEEDAQNLVDDVADEEEQDLMKRLAALEKRKKEMEMKILLQKNPAFMTLDGQLKDIIDQVKGVVQERTQALQKRFAKKFSSKSPKAGNRAKMEDKIAKMEQKLIDLNQEIIDSKEKLTNLGGPVAIDTDVEDKIIAEVKDKEYTLKEKMHDVLVEMKEIADRQGIDISYYAQKCLELEPPEKLSLSKEERISKRKGFPESWFDSKDKTWAEWKEFFKANDCTVISDKSGYEDSTVVNGADAKTGVGNSNVLWKLDD